MISSSENPDNNLPGTIASESLSATTTGSSATRRLRAAMGGDGCAGSRAIIKTVAFGSTAFSAAGASSIAAETIGPAGSS
jgi:hypothetical protein